MNRRSLEILYCLLDIYSRDNGFTLGICHNAGYMYQQSIINFVEYLYLKDDIQKNGPDETKDNGQDYFWQPHTKEGDKKRLEFIDDRIKKIRLCQIGTL